VVNSTPRPHFTPGKDPVPIVQEVGWASGPVWTGGKTRLHRDSIPDRPARSQSLYRLSYPAHTHTHTHTHTQTHTHTHAHKASYLQTPESSTAKILHQFRCRNLKTKQKIHLNVVLRDASEGNQFSIQCLILL